MELFFWPVINIHISYLTSTAPFHQFDQSNFIFFTSVHWLWSPRFVSVWPNETCSKALWKAYSVVFRNTCIFFMYFCWHACIGNLNSMTYSWNPPSNKQHRAYHTGYINYITSLPHQSCSQTQQTGRQEALKQPTSLTARKHKHKSF